MKSDEAIKNAVELKRSMSNKTESEKNDPRYFEVPLLEDEYLQWLTDAMKNKRGMNVKAVTVRASGPRLMVGVLPAEATK